MVPEISEVLITRELMRDVYYRKLCRLVDRLSIHRPPHAEARVRALTIKIRLYKLKRYELSLPRIYQDAAPSAAPNPG